MENKEGYSSVVISYRLCKTRFNSDPDVIGVELEVDEKPYTVIRVMPSGFIGIYFPGISTQLWIPFSEIRDPSLFDREKSRVFVVGRPRNDAALLIPGLLLGNIGAALLIQVLSKSAATGFISIFIPQISFGRPPAFIVASAIAVLGTMLACYIPTLKIDFEDPLAAIKQ